MILVASDELKNLNERQLEELVEKGDVVKSQITEEYFDTVIKFLISTRTYKSPTPIKSLMEEAKLFFFDPFD